MAVFVNTTLARLATTPWDNYNVSIVEGRDKVAPLGHFDYARVIHLRPSRTCRLEKVQGGGDRAFVVCYGNEMGGLCPWHNGDVVGVDTEMQRDGEMGGGSQGRVL